MIYTVAGGHKRNVRILLNPTVSFLAARCFFKKRLIVSISCFRQNMHHLSCTVQYVFVLLLLLVIKKSVVFNKSLVFQATIIYLYHLGSG